VSWTVLASTLEAQDQDSKDKTKFSSQSLCRGGLANPLQKTQPYLGVSGASVPSYHTRALSHSWSYQNDGLYSIYLDYCNSVLYGTSECNISRLQRVQNVFTWYSRRHCFPNSNCAEHPRRQLHWLIPIWRPIDYKFLKASITYEAWQPGNRHRLSHSCSVTFDQPSTSSLLLHQPPASTAFAARSFSVATPKVWNSLDLCTRSAATYSFFKNRLKTELGLYKCCYDTLLSLICFTLAHFSDHQHTFYWLCKVPLQRFRIESL